MRRLILHVLSPGHQGNLFFACLDIIIQTNFNTRLHKDYMGITELHVPCVCVYTETHTHRASNSVMGM